MNDWADLVKYAYKCYSQCGEEGIIDRIFGLIGTTNRTAVEFGCGNGYYLSNTRFFKEQGWTAHMWDGAYENGEIKKHFVTAENVNDLFARYAVPHDFDLLSLDIDGNDYWVWKVLEWQPRVVVIEFNGVLPIDSKCTIPYDPEFKHDGTDFYGASFALLCQLGREKGYVPVCQLANLNLFFVRQELVSDPPVVTYAPYPGHPQDLLQRAWQQID